MRGQLLIKLNQNHGHLFIGEFDSKITHLFMGLTSAPQEHYSRVGYMLGNKFKSATNDNQTVNPTAALASTGGVLDNDVVCSQFVHTCMR